MDIKWKTILAIMSLILLIWAGLITYVYRDGQQNLQQTIKNKIATARGITSALEGAVYPSYQTRIRSFLNIETAATRKPLVLAFKDRNRELLLQLSRPFCQILKNESEYFSSFTWILPDHRVFLRVHNPELHGQDITAMRPDIVTSIREQRQVSAYTVSGLGLDYHVTQPVFLNGEFIGAVQWGIDISLVLDLLRDKLQVAAGVLIPEDKYAFINPKNSLLPTMKVDGFGLLTTEGDAFTFDDQTVNWHEAQSWVIEQTKRYALVRLLPLPGSEGQSEGHIIAKLDLTTEHTSIWDKFWTVFVFSSLLVVAAFVILYLSLNHLLKTIFQLNTSLTEQNQNLEERIEVRSSELKKSKDQWVAMFNAIPDLVTIQNEQMVIIQANKATAEFFDMDINDIIGKHCYELFNGSTDICPGCPETDLLNKTSGYTDIVSHDHLQKTFQVTAAPIYNMDGRIESFVHITRDITEQQKLEEKLTQSQKMEAIGTLAGGIAHDFNNILSAIIGYATMAKMREPEESRLSRDLNNILTAGNRAADLVKQILTFSRKDGSQTDLFQPHLLLYEVIRMLRSSIPTSIEITTEIDPKTGWVNANQTRIHQVMMNLCTNAVQAMENEKGCLEIGLKLTDLKAAEITEEGIEPGKFALLTISDDGIGMDEQTLERIFDPYFTTRRGQQGTGLGLAVVHGIVSAMNGILRVTSTPGKGSRFEVYLPSAIGQDIQSPPEPVTALPRGTEQLLIVDDEVAIAEIGETMLSELGYHVDMTTSSLKALEMIRKNPSRYNLIITDQTMPELTGQELATEIYRLNPAIPVILCTGYSSAINEQTELTAGIHKLLYKPIQLQDLATAVRQILDEEN